LIKNLNNISVVIPTLGNKNLKLTLDSIEKSSISLLEVIIVIPNNFKISFDLNEFKRLNIVTLTTDKGGQVFQRSEGFKISKGDFVLQLDDDIEFNENFIEGLVNTLISLPNKSSVSPLLTNRLNNSVYRGSFTSLSRLFYALFYFDFLLKEGSINSFGKSIGFITINKILKVDWLPGGCVLHRKENLILKNYFPFKSKAFMEDLYHSYYLKENGISLYVNSNLNAIIVEPKEELNSTKLVTDKINEFKIRKHFFLLTGTSSIKYYWTCLVDFGVTVIKLLYLKSIEK
jgi:glycosyltransferase involved in cell wall biosynthesis